MRAETHLTDDQLVSLYYGDDPGLAGHIDTCPACRAAYEELLRTLNLLDDCEPPLPGPDFEARIWRAIPVRARRTRWRSLAAAASVAAVIATASLLVRPAPVEDVHLGRERVLLAALDDHLHRSQAVLLEMKNAAAPAAGDLDVSFEQRSAEDLVWTNRLYRQTAAGAGDAGATALLEDLEQVLLEIARGPRRISAGELEELRTRIDDAGILFKVRVYGTHIEQRRRALASL